MAKKIRPLTNTEVKQAKAQEKEYTLADGDGLQLRIKPSGSKNWVLKYSKPFTKVRTNIGLGTYPEISLKQARDKRAEARTLLAQDIDPKTHRDENAALEKELYQNTLNCVAINWFEIKKTEIKPDYAKDIWPKSVLLKGHKVNHLQCGSIKESPKTRQISSLPHM